MREIKFRVWTKPDGSLQYFTSFIGLGEYLGPNDILMQYTGLKDKNGKEIYEGDLVKFNKPIPNERSKEGSQIYKVKWMWSGYFPFNDYDSDCNVYISDPDSDYEYEIIGNIYENPELLYAN